MRLFLCCLAAALLTGCITKEDGSRQFHPWKAAQKADDNFEQWWLSSQ